MSGSDAVRGRVYAARYICPVCEGRPSEVGCLHCHGQGITSDVGGWDPEELTELPRPAGVMKSACGDCAAREGSPEDESGDTNRFDPTRPFHCHWAGMVEIEGRHVPIAQMPDGTPVGALVCAGWWDRLTGQDRPLASYREPRRHTAEGSGR
ncbi:hypothetical protein [Kitasatospora sp. NPDC088783]|uniref:hypothetical protein n=1 Tax=Kitasatospora sp. NPDC088783 TaxID=3364077 RepID=UPI00381DAF86